MVPTDLQDATDEVIKKFFGYYEEIEVSPLTANASYPENDDEGWDDVASRGYSYIVAMAYADVDGQLCIEFSDDGSSVLESVCENVTGGTPTYKKEQLRWRYVRVKYVNGGTDQTMFKLAKRYVMA